MNPPPDLSDLNAVICDLEPRLQRVVGPRLVVRSEPADVLGRVRAARDQLDRLILQLALHLRGTVDGEGAMILRTANVELDEIYTRDHPAALPGSCVEVCVSAESTALIGDLPAIPVTTAATEPHRFKHLSAVDGLVHELGGHLWLGRLPGGGHAAKIFLPRIDRPVGTMPVTTVSSATTILLVEDEADVRELIRSMLTSVGYHVVEAASGGEALQRCHDPAQAFALVMTDVVMPGMSGPELAESLIAIRPGLKVVLMSGYLDQGYVLRGAPAQDLLFLEKPFLADALLRAVREAIGGPIS